MDEQGAIEVAKRLLADKKIPHGALIGVQFMERQQATSDLPFLESEAESWVVRYEGVVDNNSTMDDGTSLVCVKMDANGEKARVLPGVGGDN